MAPTRTTHFIPTEDVLAVALELSNSSWKIALHDGKRENAAIQTVSADNPARRLAEVLDVIAKIRSKWQIEPTVRTVVLYEAGQDGFWIHRALSTLEGFEVHVCDPSSIPVARHARRAKTDRLDAIRLVESLLAWLRGERGRMRVIHVPTADEEAQRHLVRDRGQIQKEVLQHHDRIRKLLRTVGCWQSVDRDIGKRLTQGQLRCADGSVLPEQLQHRLERECERLAHAEQQFATLEKGLIEQLPAPLQERVTQLRKLKAVGPVGAVRMVLELFWREFDNRRQVGACVGLVPQPYDSGDSRVDQGISKQGNRRVRSLSIELAWLWLRYQPDSAITKWYLRRVHGNEKNKRGKRIAIVAVARRLVIAFWRYLAHGEVPEGAILKRVKGTAMSAA